MARNTKRQIPNEKEAIILIKATRDWNIPKFIIGDLPLFIALVQDLFPGISVEESVNSELMKGLEQSIIDLGLKKVDK